MNLNESARKRPEPETVAAGGRAPGALQNTDDSEQYWAVEGRKLLCDLDAPLGILYAKDETDSGVFDPLLVEALSHAVALELCEAITQSNTKRGQLHELLNETMTRAKMADGQESSPKAFDEDDWLLARLRR